MTTPVAPSATQDDTDLSHDWVVNAQISVSEKVAKHAVLRQSFRAYPVEDPETGEMVAMRIRALDVMCGGCRRNYEDVADADCEAKIDNTHLIGGDQSVRAKRKHVELPESAVLLPAPRINRRGIEAYVNGTAGRM